MINKIAIDEFKDIDRTVVDADPNELRKFGKGVYKGIEEPMVMIMIRGIDKFNTMNFERSFFFKFDQGFPLSQYIKQAVSCSSLNIKPRIVKKLYV